MKEEIKGLQNPCVLICPLSQKKYWLDQQRLYRPELHIKFYTKEQLKELYYGKVDYEGVIELHLHFGVSLDIALERANQLQGLIPGVSSKMDELLVWKDFLSKQHLFEGSPYLYKQLSQTHIYISGYSELDQELSSLLHLTSSDITYLFEDLKPIRKLKINSYETIEQEVQSFFEKAIKLAKRGVSWNQIKLFSYGPEYQWLLEKYSFFYQIPLEIQTPMTLAMSPVFHFFIQNISLGIEESYLLTQERFKVDRYDALGSLVSLLTKLSLYKDHPSFLDFLTFFAKNTKLKTTHYEEAIRKVDMESIVDPNEYVFLLGFSLGKYPKVYKDTDFFTDEEKEKANKNTSTLKTKMEAERLYSFLSRNYKRVFLFQHRKEGKAEIYDSLFVKTYQMKKKNRIISTRRYNLDLTKIEVAGYYDQEQKYGIHSPYLDTYTKNELHYLSFHHKFTPFSSYSSPSFLKLSYSQVDEYFTCPFKYFVKRVLKANLFEETFEMKIGNLFHKILEDSRSKEINLIDYEEEIIELFPTEKELFLLHLVLPQVLSVIEKNRKLRALSCYQKIEVEKEVEIMIDKCTRLVGKIDKLCIDEANASLYVVDYKTGSFSFHAEKVPYGKNLQLPIYADMVHTIYPNYHISGLFIQNICLNLFDQPSIEDVYLLDGLCVNDLQTVKNMDPSLGTRTNEEGKIIPTSEFIKGVKLQKSGLFVAKANSVKEEEIDELELTARKKVLEASQAIRNCVFPIRPIHFKSDPRSVCSYCECTDICFHDAADAFDVDLKEKKEGEDEA